MQDRLAQSLGVRDPRLGMPTSTAHALKPDDTHRGRIGRGLTLGGYGLGVALLLVSLGCTGSGRLEFASLDFRAVDPPPPRVVPLNVQECYWWTDQAGKVWIAMRSEKTPVLFPMLRFQFQLSLVLDKLPAGLARNYALGGRALRARGQRGPLHARFSSHVGVAALYRERGNRLRGSVRAQTSRVSLQWLGGWSKPVRYLMLGSFTAVYDEQRGRAILEATESDGWGRGTPRRPASQPASRPGSANLDTPHRGER